MHSGWWRTAFARRGAAAVAAAWAAGGFGLGCGDENAPGPATEPMQESLAQFSTAIETVQSRFLDGNRGTLQSLAVLVPYIESALLAPRPGASGALLGESCLVPHAVGRTFEFDGSAYAAGEATGAPPDGARFVLYEVNEANTPDRATPIGYVDLACLPEGSELGINVRVFANGTLVLSLIATGSYPIPTNLAVQGVLRTPAGDAQWHWGGSLLGAQFGWTADLPGEVAVSYTLLDQGDGNADNVLVQALKSPADFQWEIYADILAADSGEILEGPVRITSRDGSRLAACMTSTVEMPVVLDAASGGCSYFGLVALDLSPEDLDVLQGGYLVLRDLHQLARRMLDLALAGVDGARY